MAFYSGLKARLSAFYRVKYLVSLVDQVGFWVELGSAASGSPS